MNAPVDALNAGIGSGLRLRRDRPRPMNVSKRLAGALAVNRTAFGLSYLLRPQQARTSWIGSARADLPERRARVAMAVAAASTLVGAAFAFGLGAPSQRGSGQA